MKPSEPVHILRPDSSSNVFCDSPASIIFHPKIATQLDYRALCPKCALRFEQYMLDHGEVALQESA